MSGTRKMYLAAGLALAVATPLGAAQANKERVLYSFSGGDICCIPSGLIRDHDGNLYGTTFDGGNDGQGTVFRLAPDGTYTTLYAFAGGSDGANPGSGLARDRSGNLYGVTSDSGGGYDVCELGCGTIFKVAPDGTETVLHTFTGSDGADAGNDNAPILDKHGNLYGTTFGGGNFYPNCPSVYGCGVVYELTPAGTLTVLHAFDGADGQGPAGPLIADKSGNLYGVTVDGGDSSSCLGIACGTVFELTSGGSFTVLHSFQNDDGASPTGPLVLDESGKLLGTTVGGGDLKCGTELEGCGVLFRLTPDGKLAVLHEFEDASDGGFPEGGLIADGSGNLYGTTNSGGIPHCDIDGSPGCGVVFKFNPGGTEKVLYSFDDNDGGYEPSEGPLAMDRRGNLYGTTWQGGTGGEGTIFRVRN
ncbi:MAG TPA: choice-of-anchor tandem repeat GloVer-containing protein [Rhizomicrobium sp.]|nr:choice-of-anchor tandem repeat GloVer-containing protein [Rhizomicrobium sp.]